MCRKFIGCGEIWNPPNWWNVILFIENLNFHIEYKYAFYGIMCGLSELGIGGSIASFNRHYNGLIEIVNKFSNED